MERIWWLENVLVLALIVVVVRHRQRKAIAVAAALLFVGAWPPWSWPTSLFCFTPLAVLWSGDRQQSLIRDCSEAIAIGVTMTWLTSGFVSDVVPTGSWLVRLCAGLMYGLQLMLLPLVMRRLRGHSVLYSAGILTAAATFGELLQSFCLSSLVWSQESFYLTAGHTPLAQWAALITPFGVCALLYGINFLLVPERLSSGRRDWRGAMLAAGILMTAWIGGEFQASASQVAGPSFSAMLVQPHAATNEARTLSPWSKLDELTRNGIARNGPVDLIVWPEMSLAASLYPGFKLAEPPKPEARLEGVPLTLQRFQRECQPAYGTACLVGVPLLRDVVVQHYGLNVNDIKRTNAACLVAPDGRISCHEKLTLLPLMEGLPRFLDTRWFRRTILPLLQQKAPLTPGEHFELLELTTLRGATVRIAVSICYESHFCWLPQYRPSNNADAVIHLLYDGDFREHPEWTERQLLACRYRAIESRTWQLVCSTWDGSAVIDPAGRIVSRLPAKAGVLRCGSESTSPTDSLTTGGVGS